MAVTNTHFGCKFNKKDQIREIIFEYDQIVNKSGRIYLYYLWKRSWQEKFTSASFIRVIFNISKTLKNLKKKTVLMGTKNTIM